MEEVKENLKKVINTQLEECQKNKTVPSKDVLDTIQVLNLINCSC